MIFPVCEILHDNVSRYDERRFSKILRLKLEVAKHDKKLEKTVSNSSIHFEDVQNFLELSDKLSEKWHALSNFWRIFEKIYFLRVLGFWHGVLY